MDVVAPTHVFYHGNCWDGFGAAWAVWKKYGDAPKYQGVNYGDSVPDLPPDARVAILDFSWPRAALTEIRGHVENLLVLDHHKTAEADLKDCEFAVFDMEKSGATLTWGHYHDTDPPWMLRYVEDRDLWRFALPKSREVASAMRSYPKDFQVWDKLHLDVAGLKREGVTTLRLTSMMASDMAKAARWMTVGGEFVPVANATVFYSEVGEALCEMHPGIPFAAYYMDRADGMRQWGLRTKKDDVDVSEIAKKYGGGGHRAAAGFVQPSPVALREDAS